MNKLLAAVIIAASSVSASAMADSTFFSQCDVYSVDMKDGIDAAVKIGKGNILDRGDSFKTTMNGTDHTVDSGTLHMQKDGRASRVTKEMLYMRDVNQPIYVLKLVGVDTALFWNCTKADRLN